MVKEAPAFVLIHSPLVGGSFWQPAAQELERRGRECHVPAPYESDQNGSGGDSLLRWRDWPDSLASGIPPASNAILVAHSAAGILLPALAERTRARGLVFVDANIPPDGGTAPPVDAGFMAFVQSLPVVGGLLPRWSEWWPEDAMNALIPDEEARVRFNNDLPQLSLGWFRDSVEVPGWDHLGAAYVQTSDRFSPEAEAARDRGWPVAVLDGTHLHPMLAAAETADALLSVADQLAGGVSSHR